VAFYEMGCFGDVLRELKRAEKKIRIEESFLGELGVSVVALYAQTLVKLGQAFQAKVYLEPILIEPDLLHEQKTILYYTMGLAEQALDEKKNAKAWFQKVAMTDPDFKDVQQRIRLLSKVT
jgi:tetratricopeptide (TPR) repeat protein